MDGQVLARPDLLPQGDLTCLASGFSLPQAAQAQAQECSAQKGHAEENSSQWRHAAQPDASQGNIWQVDADDEWKPRRPHVNTKDGDTGCGRNSRKSSLRGMGMPTQNPHQDPGLGMAIAQLGRVWISHLQEMVALAQSHDGGVRIGDAQFSQDGWINLGMNQHEPQGLSDRMQEAVDIGGKVDA
ncbi:hypothetical protein GALL_485310 [mine drainage metagenome]|uniref:Uncharacterized protein n=1 Tax=mine drainage metagenome TaxID=410659 RepID=A0A1J5PE05_9ZZZZ